MQNISRIVQTHSQNYKEALATWKTAIRLNEKLGNVSSLICIYLNISSLFLLQKEYANAYDATSKAMQDCSELREIDRYTLCSMVKKISVYENHRIEIEFYYTDQYRIMREVNKRIKDEQKKNCVAERSA